MTGAKHLQQGGVAILLLCGLGAFRPVQAAQTNEQCRPQVEGDLTFIFCWIDEQGEKTEGGKILKVEPTWSKADAKNDSKPALRVSVENNFPQNWEVLDARTDGLAIVEGVRERTLVLDLNSSGGAINFTFKDPEAQTHVRSLTISLGSQKTLLISNDECASLGLGLKAENSPAGTLFLALACKANGKLIDLRFIRSLDSTWEKESSSHRLSADPATLVDSFSADFLGENAVSKQPLPQVIIQGGKGGNAPYRVHYERPAAKASAYQLTLGLGTSLYNYSEKLGPPSHSEIALVGKIGFVMPLSFLSKRWEAGVSAFRTLLTLQHTPVAIHPTKFYGINARIGYRLPFGTTVNYTLLGGWYFWGMDTGADGDPTQNYGMSSVAGPQLFFSASRRKNDPAERGWTAYGKFAPISGGYLRLPDFKSNEIALGGNLELFNVFNRPLALTLDLARTSISEGVNSMTLYSLSTGVQRSF